MDTGKKGKDWSSACAASWRRALRPGLDQRLGGVEHQWARDGERQYEINHCFSVAVPGLTAETTPPAREMYLSFTWAPVDRLDAVALEPAPLRTLLATDFDTGTPWWSSTIDKGAQTRKKWAFRKETQPLEVGEPVRFDVRRSRMKNSPLKYHLRT